LYSFERSGYELHVTGYTNYNIQPKRLPLQISYKGVKGPYKGTRKRESDIEQFLDESIVNR